jgi:hypothetical protein
VVVFSEQLTIQEAGVTTYEIAEIIGDFAIVRLVDGRRETIETGIETYARALERKAAHEKTDGRFQTYMSAPFGPNTAKQS